MKILSVFTLLILCLGAAAPATMGQSQSANYTLVAGTAIGGGGSSSSAGYLLAGGIPLPGGDVSSSASYGLIGGVAAVVGASTGMAFYDAALLEIVPIADRMLKVPYLGVASASGTFYYRYGGEESFLPEAMTDGPGDTLTYTLSSSRLTSRGLEYYFEIELYGVFSYIGSPFEPYAFAVEMTNSQAQRPDPLPDAQFRIVGLPINANVHSVEDVFSDDLGTYDDTQWRLGSYETVLDSVVEYPDAPPVYPGRGYWLIARGSETYGAPGLSMRPSLQHGGTGYYRVDLEQNWNQVANPFPFDVAWDEVLFEDNSVIQTGHPTELLDDAAYWYNGTAYQEVSEIPAWDGFFVYIKKPNASILFPYSESPIIPVSRADAVAPAVEDGWAVNLRLESRGLVDDHNLAGVSESALPGADEIDLAEPPPPPGGPVLAFAIPGDKPILKRTDFRPPLIDGAQWEIILKNCARGVLRASGLNRIPAGMSAWLEMKGSTISLAEEYPIEIPDDTRSATLIIGTDEYLSNRNSNLPDLNFHLGQNYPNPFNPVTRMTYSIPSAGHVNLTIYNVLGQRVRTLIDRELPAGLFVATWDGIDDRGKSVASGVYFCRIIYGDEIEQRKMVLLR